MFTTGALVPTQIPVSAGGGGEGKSEYFLLSACNTLDGNAVDKWTRSQSKQFS